MLPGLHRKHNNASHNTKEVEEQAQSYLYSGKTLTEGNDIDNVDKNNIFLGNVLHSKNNTSDKVDFHMNVSAQNDTHSSDLSSYPY